jgi:hypothetical protein
MLISLAITGLAALCIHASPRRLELSFEEEVRGLAWVACIVFWLIFIPAGPIFGLRPDFADIDALKQPRDGVDDRKAT